MSHYKKYAKYQHKQAVRQVSVPVQDHFLLEVLRQAERAGAKAGAKTAKKALKYASRGGPALSGPEVEELYAAAEKAGAASALLAARKILGSNVGHAPLETERTAPVPAHAGPMDERREPAMPGHAADARSAVMPSGEPRLQGMGQHVLTIKRVEKLSPEMVRLVAGAPRLAGYRSNSKADQYVKMYYADPELGLQPPYDIKALRQRLPRHQLPRSKSYTIRWIDETAEELAIDFVLHDDPGSAGQWASKAKVGDHLVISGARGKFTPRANCEYFVFAADEAGIPAISSALDKLPREARGIALLEVAGSESEFEIPHPPGIELRWLHRDGQHPGTTNLLPMALGELPHPPYNTSVMAHAERSASKAMSNIVGQWGLDKKSVHISSYWTLRPAKPRY